MGGGRISRNGRYSGSGVCVCVCVWVGGWVGVCGGGVLQKWRGLPPSALYDYIILNVFWLHKRMSAVHHRGFILHIQIFFKKVCLFLKIVNSFSEASDIKIILLD